MQLQPLPPLSLVPVVAVAALIVVVSPEVGDGRQHEGGADVHSPALQVLQRLLHIAWHTTQTQHEHKPPVTSRGPPPSGSLANRAALQATSGATTRPVPYLRPKSATKTLPHALRQPPAYGTASPTSWLRQAAQPNPTDLLGGVVEHGLDDLLLEGRQVLGDLSRRQTR